MFAFPGKTMAFMNFSWWLSGKISSGSGRSRLSSPALYISVFSIAVSVAVMLVSLAILKGFSREIEKKIAAFHAPLQVLPFEQNNSLEPYYFPVGQGFTDSLQSIEGIRRVRPYLYKGALLKHRGTSEAAIVKGVSVEAFSTHYSRFLPSSEHPSLPAENEVYLASGLAQTLGAKKGDRVLFYFLERPSKVRKLLVAGIFSSGFGDFDQRLVLCRSSMLQKLGKMGEDQFAGIEIETPEGVDPEQVKSELLDLLPVWLQVKTTREEFPQVFDWLSLQDTNVLVIGTIMLLVCMLNILTILLVQMLEHTHTLGVLHALGMPARSSGRIFVFLTSRYALLGLLAGNAAGMGAIFLQDSFHLIGLDSASYYLSFVPVYADWSSWFWVNAGTLLLAWVSSTLPVGLINRFSVRQNLQFR